MPESEGLSYLGMCRCGHERARHVVGTVAGRCCFPQQAICACLGYRSAASESAPTVEAARAAGDAAEARLSRQEAQRREDRDDREAIA